MSFLAKFTAALALLAAFVLGMVWAVGAMIEHRLAGPDPVTIVSGSLDGLRAQNRISAFAARFVSVATSTRSQFGLSTTRTLVMPGTVEYQVDFARLTAHDLRWNPRNHILAVTLPPVEATPPRIDLTEIRAYGERGILSAITDADARLETANRAAGQRELARQANAPLPLSLARAATRRAVADSFALPLRAAGLDAKVVVRFRGETTDPDERWDVTPTIADALANRR